MNGGSLSIGACLAFFVMLSGTSFSLARGDDSGPTHARLLISGAGPGGLAAALAAMRRGVDPKDIVLLEWRTPEGGEDRQPYASRTRVAALDNQGTQILRSIGVTPPGTKVRQTIARLPDGSHRFFPNASGWRTAYNASFNGRGLERLTTIRGLELAELEEFQRRGGTVRFGEEAVLSFDAEGKGRIRSGETTYTGDLIVVAEGANSNNLRDLGWTHVGESTTSHLLSLDVELDPSAEQRPGSFRAREGDIFHVLDPRQKTMLVGSVAPGYASLMLMLPKGLERPSPAQHERYLTLLRRALRDYGLEGRIRRPEGSFHLGSLRMADRSLLGRNVVVIGDALRTVDSISALGANTALKDGEAVGAYFADVGRRGPIGAMDRLKKTLASNTRYAFEVALLFREIADSSRTNPSAAFKGYRMGLSARRGPSSLTDVAKNLAVQGLDALLGAEGFRQVSPRGPRPLFRSPRRKEMVGVVHGDHAPRWTDRRSGR